MAKINQTKQNDLSIDVARQFFKYEPDTGRIVWIKAASQRSRVGEEAGTIVNTGYRHIGLFGKLYQAHRVAWLLFYGEWPECEIDHRDRNPLNNRISNLRQVTKSQNLLNRPLFKSSTTGYRGVTRSRAGKFVATIGANGKSKYLGTYDCPKAAHRAYLNAYIDVHGFKAYLENGVDQLGPDASRIMDALNDLERRVIDQRDALDGVLDRIYDAQDELEWLENGTEQALAVLTRFD